MKYYTATKSRNPGRDSWSVIFRHPARLDTAGKAGRRVRRGLGTADETEASQLVTQLNELLSTPTMWEPASRQAAAARLDARVVDIFYDGLEGTRTDFRAVRDDLLPLPQEQDYRKVLLLGTTGAGKTTVVRQLLGTDPATERFPSTSTAKTTVADTELILTGDGPYRAAVTFAQRDEVVDYLAENVSEAALAVFNGKGDAHVTRRLLDHVNQRYRFSYVLGRSALAGDDADDLVDDDDVVDDADLLAEDDPSSIDTEETTSLIRESVRGLRALVTREETAAREAIHGMDDDPRVIEEFIEDYLDTELRQHEDFHQIVDALSDEIEKRFALLSVGELRRNRQGWPVSWTWETPDREAFVRTISRFTSNYAPQFGRLLTPLVNGIRVAGPFTPKWALDAPRLVLVDGEGLGHTPSSVATLSTHVADLVEEVDAVLLVDNAMQPMQAAPVAALKGIAVSGNGMKLHFLFTHFDQVKGDNLPTFSDREEHVLASAENVLKAIGDELGPAAERLLRRRLDDACFFVGGIQDLLNPKQKSGNRSIQQLEQLLEVLANPVETTTGASRPVFDRMNLSLAVAEAAKNFHAKWRGLLGLESNANAPKEHWTRVKALTRRLAEGWADEYDTLRPVADLRFELQLQVYLMLQRPVRWEGGDPTEDEQQAIIDEVSNAITRKLMELTRRRLMEDAQRAWQQAYVQRGTGSTFVRARIIAADVYEQRAPVPTVTASPDQNRFLKDVAACIDDVAEELALISLE